MAKVPTNIACPQSDCSERLSFEPGKGYFCGNNHVFATIAAVRAVNKEPAPYQPFPEQPETAAPLRPSAPAARQSAAEPIRPNAPARKIPVAAPAVAVAPKPKIPVRQEEPAADPTEERIVTMANGDVMLTLKLDADSASYLAATIENQGRGSAHDPEAFIRYFKEQLSICFDNGSFW